MDLEILSGLQQAPTGFNFLSGAGAPTGFNYLAGLNPQLSMMGAMMGLSPEQTQQVVAAGAMMGWNPFSSLANLAKGALHAGQSALSTILPGPIGDLFAKGHIFGQAAPHPAAHHPAFHPMAHAPMAQEHPLTAVQPHVPGVAERGGKVQPLGFENGAFVAGGSAVITVRARPQRPIRGGRVVGSYSRTGASATGLLTLVQLVVATDGQLLSGDPISFDSLAPTAFGVGVNLTPASVGNEIFATVAISALPTMTDRVDFNLTIFGLTIG
jgi:hypothetical protein